MSRNEVFGGLGIGLVGGAILVLFPGIGGGLAFFLVGAFLIVHAVLGKKKEQEDTASSFFIPSAKELHEVEEYEARSQKARLDLAAAQREQRIVGYVDFLAHDFETKIAEAKNRGAV